MSPTRVEGSSRYAIRKASKRLKEACGSITDPKNMSDAERLKLNTAADRLLNLTGSLSRVLRVMEEGNSAFNRRGDTPEQVEDAFRESQISATQARRGDPYEGHPFLDSDPLYRQLAQGMIQTAFLTGETVVVRTSREQLKESGLPSHVMFPTPLLPGFPVS